MADKNKLNHDGLLQLEQPLIKAPLEQLKKNFRLSQKHIEKEMMRLNQSIIDITTKESQHKIDSQEAMKLLDGVVARLMSLKKKLEELRREEDKSINSSKVRLNHLTELTEIQNADSDKYYRWSKTRLNRYIVDYMLRNNYIESAKILAKNSNIEDYVDIDLFMQANIIEDALRNHSCTECLHWCNEHRSNLKKIKSNLEFKLRLQEYVNLVKENKYQEAINYAKKHLTPYSDVNLKDIQRAMALLAFSPNTKCEVYRKIFDDNYSWNELIKLFKADNYTLNSLSSRPPLNFCLETGLSALKSPCCFREEDKNINCPVCSNKFNTIAKELPNAHHDNSCIVCRISGKIMNEDNEPMALPNGYIYSYSALQEMAEKNNGIITCPRTGEQFEFKDCVKVYIS